MDDWVTEEGYDWLSRMESSIHRYMTVRLGWRECVESNPYLRMWNFLDYLEETYVIPTYQSDANTARNLCSGRLLVHPTRGDTDSDQPVPEETSDS